MRRFERRPARIEPEELSATWAQWRASDYGPTGEATQRALAATFRPGGAATLVERMSFFAPVAAELTSSRFVGRGRLGWLRKPITPNAFVLELWQVHLDEGLPFGRRDTLRANTPFDDARPLRVSILALNAAVRVLLGEDKHAEAVERGEWGHVRGELPLSVEALRQGAAVALCEQYVLPPHVAERVPAFSVSSKGRFDAYLAAAGAGPPADIEIDT